MEGTVMSFIEELLITFMYSRRAQFAIFFGLVAFIGILLIGQHMTNTLHFEGMFAPFADAIRPIMEFRYKQAAWGALVGFWVLAGKILIRDRKKYLYF